MRPTRHLSFEMVQRIVADALLVNLALLVTLAARFLSLFALRSQQAGVSVAYYDAVMQESMRAYGYTSPFLVLTSLAVFYLSGFYTHGRAYRSRYKALIVVQAVTVVYLIFGAAIYLFLDRNHWFPRSAWLGGWLSTIVLVGGARLWAALWRRTVRPETISRGSPQSRPVHSVAVIGGAGYIGSVLVRKLLARGYRVTVLDALVYGDEGICDLYGTDGFTLIRGDMRDIEAVTRALQYADAVIHLGALVGDPACALDEKLTLEINLAATRMIAEAARGFGIQRFIFASTCSVYGASNELLDERSSLNPVSLYARTKIESERVLLALNHGSFAPTILRFATIYGLSPRPRFDLVVNLLAARAVCEKSITINGGEQWRPFVHVADVAEGIIKCLDAPLHAVRGQVFNLGSDEQNYQISQLGDLIRRLMPETEVIRQGEDMDLRNYRVSFAKIRKHLGFVPSHTIEEGIQEIKMAIEGCRISDYRQARYSNYKTLSEGNGEILIHHTHMTPLYAGNLEPLALSPDERVTSLALQS